MKIVRIYQRGTLAEIKEINKKCMIMSATIRGEDVLYECEYFHDGELKTVYLIDRAFVCGEEKKTAIGFKDG